MYRQNFEKHYGGGGERSGYASVRQRTNEVTLYVGLYGAKPVFAMTKADDNISVVVLCASERFRNTYTFVSQKLIFLYGVMHILATNCQLLI